MRILNLPAAASVFVTVKVLSAALDVGPDVTSAVIVMLVKSIAAPVVVRVAVKLSTHVVFSRTDQLTCAPVSCTDDTDDQNSGALVDDAVSGHQGDCCGEHTVNVCPCLFVL